MMGRLSWLSLRTPMDKCRFCSGLGEISCCKTSDFATLTTCNCCDGTGHAPEEKKPRLAYLHKFHFAYPTIMPMVHIGELPEGENIKDYYGIDASQ